MNDCLYPVKTPGRAYRMGCRCERCRTYVQRRDRGRGYYPRERVAAVVRDWLRHGTQQQLSALTGIADRELYRILNGPSAYELEANRATGEHVSLRTLDRLLCGMGLVHLFLLPPEDGGFADIYLNDTELEVAA